MIKSSSCSNSIIATHYRAAAATEVHDRYIVYKFIRVRRAAAYNSIVIIYQIQVLCCETAHGVYVTKERNNNSNNHTQSSSNGSSTMYTNKTDFSIAQTKPQPSSYILFHSNKKREMSHKKNQYHRQHGFEPRTTTPKGQQPTCPPTQVLA